MAELTEADLKPQPSIYSSSRALWEVLIGDDAALPLIEASASGDNTTLEHLLSQPVWAGVALEQPHCIYSVNDSATNTSSTTSNETSNNNNNDDVKARRQVFARPMSNLHRAIIQAGINGHAAVFETLLRFASQQQDVKPRDLLGYHPMVDIIRSQHVEVLEVLLSADPSLVEYHLHHGILALDEAVRYGKTRIVEVLLRHGANTGPTSPSNVCKRNGSYGTSLLSLAAKSRDPRMLELFLQYNNKNNKNASIAGSGALHVAAEIGALDRMRLLIDYGADVNERLSEQSLFPRDRSSGLLAGRTPLDLAARKGQDDAVKLLEQHGGLSSAQVRRNEEARE